MADKIIPTDLSALTTPAANDYLLITDTSDTSNAKKITYADLFNTPPNGGVSLGGASNGFTNLYLNNTTHNGRITISSNTIGFYYDATPYWWYNNTSISPWSAGLISLGTASYGFSSAYFTNGTATGAIKYSTNTLQIGSTTGTNIELMRGGASIVGLSGTVFFPVTTGSVYLGNTTYRWLGLYLANDSSNTATGTIGYSSNTLQIGSTSDHAVNILQNNAASITLDTDGRPIFKAPASAIADGGLAASQLSMYLDETGGAEKLIIKAKLSGGGVKTFTISAD